MSILWGDLLPGRTDRAVFVGQTGSGKTTLARYLSLGREYVLAIDPKGLLEWPGYRLVRRAADLPKLAPKEVKRIVYRPDPAELVDPEAINNVLGWIYARRNTTLYVDEVYGILPGGTNIPSNLVACVTRGREHRVEVWSACQRPARIPLMLLSEAEHYYVFRLTMEEDRKRVEGLTGIAADKILALRKREFFHFDFDGGIKGPLKLNLGR